MDTNDLMFQIASISLRKMGVRIAGIRGNIVYIVVPKMNHEGMYAHELGVAAKRMLNAGSNTDEKYRVKYRVI